LTAIFPPSPGSAFSTGNALVPIGPHRPMPVSAGQGPAGHGLVGFVTIPAEARGVMRLSSAATRKPLAVIERPGQLAGPARDLAYRRADMLDAAPAGLGQVVHIFV